MDLEERGGEDQQQHPMGTAVIEHCAWQLPLGERQGKYPCGQTRVVRDQFWGLGAQTAAHTSFSQRRGGSQFEQ